MSFKGDLEEIAKTKVVQCDDEQSLKRKIYDFFCRLMEIHKLKLNPFKYNFVRRQQCTFPSFETGIYLRESHIAQYIRINMLKRD